MTSTATKESLEDWETKQLKKRNIVVNGFLGDWFSWKIGISGKWEKSKLCAKMCIKPEIKVKVKNRNHSGEPNLRAFAWEAAL